jgi:LacI family transcriptional regulator
VVYQGLETAPENWQHAQNRLADWLQTLPPQTGIIAVTDARARHVLQVCEHLHIPVPEKLCVIGIDNEELTRYLSRVALSSVAQGTRQMGYQAAKLLHRLLDKEACRFSVCWCPVRVVERRSTDYRSLNDPAVIQAMHYIRNHACKGIKVDQVLDSVGISRSNLEKRFKEEVGETIHAVIHAKNWRKHAACWSPRRCRSTKSRRCAATRRCNISIRCFERVRHHAEGVSGSPQRGADIERKRLPVEGVF